MTPPLLESFRQIFTLERPATAGPVMTLADGCSEVVLCSEFSITCGIRYSTSSMASVMRRFAFLAIVALWSTAWVSAVAHAQDSVSSPPPAIGGSDDDIADEGDEGGSDDDIADEGAEGNEGDEGAEGAEGNEGNEGDEGDTSSDGVDRRMRTEGLDDAQARARFRVGEALYSSGRFLEAAEEFETAYRLSNRSSLLYNAYLAFRDAGQLADAVRTLELYLETHSDPEDTARLRQRVAAMRITLAEEAEERERLAQERAAAEARAEEQRRVAEMQRRRAEEAEQGLNPVGWVVGGIGVALLAGGGGAGIATSRQLDELEDSCPDDRCVVGFDLEKERSDVRSAQIATDVLLVAGLAVTATGVGLLFLRGKRGTDEDTLDVSAGCSSTGCHAQLRTVF